VAPAGEAPHRGVGRVALAEVTGMMPIYSIFPRATMPQVQSPDPGEGKGAGGL
jgi:hypothetical protein